MELRVSSSAGWRMDHVDSGCERGEASGTFALHTLLPSFLIFLLGDPHLLESSQGGQYGSPDPGAEASLNGAVAGDELQAHARRRLLRQLTIQPVIEALEQSVPARDDDAAVQTRPDVYITHPDTTGDHMSDPQHRISRETLYIGWVKESLWDAQSLCSIVRVVPIGHLVVNGWHLSRHLFIVWRVRHL